MTDFRPLKDAELRPFAQPVKRVRRDTGAPAPGGSSPTDEAFADVPYTFSAVELPSGKAAVAGTVTPGTLATTPIVGPFTPIAGRGFNVTIDGGAGVAAQLERSFDGGATWFVKYRASDIAANPPSFTDSESEVGVQYRIVVTAITGGTVTIRLSQ
jgi:hypothetical protein